MNRRSFCKFLPAAPVVLMAEGARAASEYAPTDDSRGIKINASKKELPRARSATLSVGADGNLWLKNSSDDTWRKVMVE